MESDWADHISSLASYVYLPFGGSMQFLLFLFLALLNLLFSTLLVARGLLMTATTWLESVLDGILCITPERLAAGA